MQADQSVQTKRVSMKPKLSAYGRRVLNKALKAMVRYPDTFDIGDKRTRRPRPYCGTVACIAGHGFSDIGRRNAKGYAARVRQWLKTGE